MSALPVFSEGLLQDVLVEREISDDVLEAGILVLELAHPSELTHAQVRVFLLPDVARRLANAELPANVRRGRPAVSLPQGVGDLLFRELRSLHGPPLLVMGGPQNLPRQLQLRLAPVFRDNVTRSGRLL